MLSSCNDESGKDAAILQELKEVSNRHSQSNNNKNANAHQTPSVIKGDVKPRDDGMEKENSFLAQTGENRELNQYWYSKHTIAVLCNAIREQLQRGGRVAFLSTPSLFFSLSPKEREQCVLFDVSLFAVSVDGMRYCSNFLSHPSFSILPIILSSIPRGNNLVHSLTFMITTIQQISRKAIRAYLI